MVIIRIFLLLSFLATAFLWDKINNDTLEYSQMKCYSGIFCALIELSNTHTKYQQALTSTLAAKGGDGMPVNSCTMARKLEVSIVSTVVGTRRDARIRFLDPLAVAVPIATPAPAPALPRSLFALLLLNHFKTGLRSWVRLHWI